VIMWIGLFYNISSYGFSSGFTFKFLFHTTSPSDWTSSVTNFVLSIHVSLIIQ
jgi:hypothetical protein